MPEIAPLPQTRVTEAVLFQERCLTYLKPIHIKTCDGKKKLYELPCHFKEIIVRYKKIYNFVRQTACLAVNPLKVKNLLASLIARR